MTDLHFPLSLLISDGATACLNCFEGSFDPDIVGSAHCAVTSQWLSFIIIIIYYLWRSYSQIYVLLQLGNTEQQLTALTRRHKTTKLQANSFWTGTHELLFTNIYIGLTPESQLPRWKAFSWVDNSIVNRLQGLFRRPLYAQTPLWGPYWVFRNSLSAHRDLVIKKGVCRQHLWQKDPLT